MIVLIGVFAATTATALATTVSWGTAIQVPGTAAPSGLNVGGAAYVNSVSCARAGKCAAGGSYRDNSGYQAFVVGETSSGWRNALEVPGTAAPTGLNVGGAAEVTSISCTSAGNCAAGGGYTDGSGAKQAFVVDATNGHWGNAAEVQLAGLNVAGNAEVNSISCTSAGNCAAGGYYSDNGKSGLHPGSKQAFVVDEHNGHWGTAIPVPGLKNLNAGDLAFVRSISCGSAGYCSAGGEYSDTVGGGTSQAFVVSETPGGGWGSPITVHGTPPLSLGGHATVTAVSCTGAAACTASGEYRAAGNVVQSFVVSRMWAWGQALRLMSGAGGPSNFNSASEASAVSISCSAPGSCVTGGSYQPTGSSAAHAFVAESFSGTWTYPVRLWGVAAASNGSQMTSVSCADPGDCVAGGIYYDASHEAHPFLAPERGGNWYAATQVPGVLALGSVIVDRGVFVSCAVNAGTCGIGGSYQDGAGKAQAFVTNP